MLAYRLFLSLFAPVLLARLLLRRLRGAETAADLRQRLGGATAPARPGAIWLHGASMGELAAARSLLTALLHTLPGVHLVVTANTVSGRDMVTGWDLPRTEARLAPLDLRWALWRFRRAWRPRLLIVLENELWPNRLATARCPAMVVGARMSARSFRRWNRLPGLARRLMGHIRHLCPQDDASARHFAALGLDPGRIGPTGTLKAGVDLPPPDPALLARYRALYPRADTLLAASTHDGEDEIVLAAVAAARRRRPGLRLILAPRHPARGAALAEMIARTGLACARRSAGQQPAADTAVYLADTLGEMPLWYALAGTTFVGASLVPRGGHTPFEPAAANSAILHGPDTANFSAAYAALDAGGGARAVLDADGLAGALLRLDTGAAQAEQAARARQILQGLDDSPRLIGEILKTVRGLLKG